MMVLTPVFSDEKSLPFPTSLLYNFTSSPSYEILYFIHCFTFQFFIHFTIAGNDILILAFLLAVSQQYYILRSSFAAFDTEVMLKVNKSLRKKYGDKLELKYDERKEYLYRCVRQHHMLLSFTKKLNSTLNPLELSQLVVSIIAICFGILRITSKGNINSADIFSSFYYITAYIFQLAIDCYLGTYLFYQGSLLPDSIFCCNWQNLDDTKLKKDLMFILLHSQRVPQFSSYGLYNMNMESFLRVLRVAFSFYTMMSNVGR
ncbi:odorant receptor 33b-like [Diorhabda carinulata]|uniref:odorant receptor 33b-like n=1 Tax=Diorhabda sublineata TaxID=1163346 RepID=UPI0024E09E44|nr:odorant receptor 33b-like [Diorhabda sublineata]XP_057654391.1 odorant receptor 33b-like [Diorhabda carinulata]